MTPDPDLADSEYIDYMLRHYKQQLKKAGEGSARDNINLATFEDRNFPLPPKREQEVAVEKLNEIAVDSATLQSHYRAKLADLDALRQALLQKAFAGELS